MLRVINFRMYVCTTATATATATATTTTTTQLTSNQEIAICAVRFVDWWLSFVMKTCNQMLVCLQLIVKLLLLSVIKI